MATIKSYTDISQSKKLAEILPLESADMKILSFGIDIKKRVVPIDDIAVLDREDEIPCWSLAALLNIIPKHINEYNVLRIDISANNFAIWYDEIGFGVNNNLPDITVESAIDACYELILKLHEQKLL